MKKHRSPPIVNRCKRSLSPAKLCPVPESSDPVRSTHSRGSFATGSPASPTCCFKTYKPRPLVLVGGAFRLWAQGKRPIVLFNFRFVVQRVSGSNHWDHKRLLATNQSSRPRMCKGTHTLLCCVYDFARFGMFIHAISIFLLYELYVYFIIMRKGRHASQLAINRLKHIGSYRKTAGMGTNRRMTQV